MKIQNMKALVEKAKSEHPDQKSNKPEKATVVETYWEKGNKECSGWCGQVKGFFIDTEDDGKEKLDIEWGTREVPICFSEITWKSKKGENPKGIKKFHLVDGIFKMRLTKNDKDDKGTFHILAVDNGEAVELTENQALSIFQSESASNEV